MNRWLVLTWLLVLPLAGCTGKDEGGNDPTPTPTTITPTPATSPTRATPTPASTPPATPPPSATPSATPPTASPTPPTGEPPASTKSFEWAMLLTAGTDAGVPDPIGVGVAGIANCDGFGAATILGGNLTATYESASPLAGDIEVVILAPDGSVAVRQAGPSPIALTIPPIPRGEDGPTVVVQFAEEGPLAGNVEVQISGTFLLPAGEGAPGQDGAGSCERVA